MAEFPGVSPPGPDLPTSPGGLQVVFGLLHVVCGFVLVFSLWLGVSSVLEEARQRQKARGQSHVQRFYQEKRYIHLGTSVTDVLKGCSMSPLVFSFMPAGSS